MDSNEQPNGFGNDVQNSNSNYKNEGFEDPLTLDPLSIKETTEDNKPTNSQDDDQSKSASIIEFREGKNYTMEYNPVLIESSAGTADGQDDNPYLKAEDSQQQPETPKQPVYVVQKGDSLMKVAFMHNVR